MGSDKKIGIITQARTTSTRLPRKVLMKLDGKTLLEHHMDRLKWSGLPVFLATTINQSDDEIVALSDKLLIPNFRGSEDDVLSRYYGCAQKYKLDVIVRVTSDCPLIDGNLIKDGVEKFLAAGNDAYVSNCLIRTYPRGFDFEVFSFEALEKAFKNAVEKPEREHVTPYIRNPDKNKNLQIIDQVRPASAGKHRITVDEEDDFKLIQLLIEKYHLADKKADEIIEFLERHPEISKINAHVEQKKV
ncbi:MAG: glycosyltransferase family protein [Bacteriovorax sp.]|nr:glycosyltransferase family protein [Bacteriovorax sp.]